MFGWTPLMSAVEHGYLEAPRLLLDKGTDIHPKNKYAWNALKVAREWVFTELAKPPHRA